MLELDLIGRPVTLSESDARWIYAQARTASGHSIGARDLVTRLQGLDPDQERKQLLLTRPEASALARVLAEADETPPGCDELRAYLVELLATSHRPQTHESKEMTAHESHEETQAEREEGRPEDPKRAARRETSGVGRAGTRRPQQELTSRARRPEA